MKPPQCDRDYYSGVKNRATILEYHFQCNPRVVGCTKLSAQAEF